LNEFLQVSVHFIVLGISLAAPVGPIKLEMIKRGLNSGFWPSWLVGLGAATADLIFMFSIFLGLAPFLQVDWVQKTMMLIGISMLIFLGISTFKGALKQQKQLVFVESKLDQAPYWTGFLLALMNPYNFVFWFGVYGGALQSVSVYYGSAAICMLSLFIIAGIVLWNINVAFTAHFFRSLINETMIRMIMILAGMGLLGFACHLGFQLWRM
jgi:threonine/homoserine/homoserine lactone efflux protein